MQDIMQQAFLIIQNNNNTEHKREIVTALNVDWEGEGGGGYTKKSTTHTCISPFNRDHLPQLILHSSVVLCTPLSLSATACAM